MSRTDRQDYIYSSNVRVRLACKTAELRNLTSLLLLFRSNVHSLTPHPDTHKRAHTVFQQNEGTYHDVATFRYLQTAVKMVVWRNITAKHIKVMGRVATPSYLTFHAIRESDTGVIHT